TNGRKSAVSRTKLKAKPKQEIKIKLSAAELERKKALELERRALRINQLVLDHRENGRKIARSILRRWRVRMPADEIYSIVDLALCEAAKRFKRNQGASFLTFFFYHLRGHLVRSVARAAQGNNLFLSYAKSMGIETGDYQLNNSEMIWPNLPEYLIFGQNDIETPENLIMRQEKITHCQDACDKLDTLEKEVIDRSFATDESLVDIADSLGYSRCHISRVKKGALVRLKGLLGGLYIEKPEKEKASSTKSKLVDRQIFRRSRRKKAAQEESFEIDEKAAA
ncbi:MAG: sigma-70 family RNA polymerase sigma factor, partial [Proteobacteria bacterium]|nr:sigma-70 family RNA polymerase sigma factor [Pseudomonadota bacterium]